MKTFLFTQTQPVVVYESVDLVVKAETYEQAQQILSDAVKEQRRKRTHGTYDDLPFETRNYVLNTHKPSPSFGSSPYYSDSEGGLLDI